MRIHFCWKAVAAWPFLLAAVCGAQQASISVALVPAVAQSGSSGPVRNFIIDNSGTSNSTATLTFDLRAIPKGVDVSAILRVMAVNGPTGTQQVRIFADGGSGPSIAQFSINKNSPKAAESTGSGLSAAVKSARAADAALVLSLRSDSVRSSQEYYGNGAEPQYRPRLIVSWQDRSTAQTRNGLELSYRGDPSDATPWRYSHPTGALVSELVGGLKFDHISAGPAFHGDDILLIANTPNAGSTLYGIGWDGSKRWSYSFPQLADGSAGWKYAILDSDRNRLLAFASKRVLRQFDWTGANGAPASTGASQIDGMALSERPAVSAGGLIAYVNDNGYVSSLSPLPGLEELWRSTSVGKVPPAVLSPRGGQSLLYFFGNENKARGFYAADPVRGVLRFPGNGVPAFPEGSELGDYSHLDTPLAVPVKDREWVYLSSSDNENGVLEGYASFDGGEPSGWLKPKTGAITRCAAPPPAGGAEPAIYCIQNNELRGFHPDGTSICAGSAPAGVTASNMIADGAGNIYYFADGVFYGFDSQCRSLFATRVKLPIATEGGNDFTLSVGPNGVMYARSVQDLFAIQPVQSAWPANAEANTRYVASGDMQAPQGAIPTGGPVAFAAVGGQLTFGPVTIPSGADVSCTASKGIAFSAGFTVAQGAALRCGFEPPPQGQEGDRK